MSIAADELVIRDQGSSEHDWVICVIEGKNNYLGRIQKSVEGRFHYYTFFTDVVAHTDGFCARLHLVQLHAIVRPFTRVDLLFLCH